MATGRDFFCSPMYDTYVGLSPIEPAGGGVLSIRLKPRDPTGSRAPVVKGTLYSLL